MPSSSPLCLWCERRHRPALTRFCQKGYRRDQMGKQVKKLRPYRQIGIKDRMHWRHATDLNRKVCLWLCLQAAISYCSGQIKRLGRIERRPTKSLTNTHMGAHERPTMHTHEHNQMVLRMKGSLWRRGYKSWQHSTQTHTKFSLDKMLLVLKT